mgnify:CR=1 FL=1
MVLQDVLRSFQVILSGLWVVLPVFGEKPSVAKPAKPPVVPTSVAVFGLGGAVSEGPGGGDLSSLLSGTAPESLRSLVSRMDRAGRDKQIAAVALLYNGPVIGSAQLEELVSAVDRLRETGKPVYLLAESMGTGGYVLASHCSHLSVVPGGELALVGLATEAPYIRGWLDWLGVEPDFLTCGDFKSAGEMYMREGPSRNAAAMGDRLLDSQYRTYVDLIASGRNVDRKQVRHWIDQGPYTASRARAAGLIDAVEHRREFYDRMRRAHGQTSRLLTRYGLPPRQQVDLSSPLGLIQFYSKMLQGPGRVVNRGDTIAMVYLEGTIVGGSMPISPTGGAAASSETLRKTLAVVERDKAIKAVVLRGAPKWGVEVVAIIGAAHDVPAGVGISVESPILGGSPALALEPPRDSDGKTFLPRDGTALLEVREAIPSLASHFAAEWRSGLKATVDDLREELSRAQGNLDRLAGAWVSVAEHLDLSLIHI